MYHLHLGVIRVCAIRSVACAGRRRRRRWWRLTHLAAAVVDILARTDQQGRAHTHVTPSRYRRRESGREIPRSGRRRPEESVAERGSHEPGVVAEGPLGYSAGARRRGCVIVRLDYGGDIRRWLSARSARHTASGESGEFGLERGGKLALIEAGDSSHAHPGGSCKRSTGR